MSPYTEFNLNHNVWIKLTDRGRAYVAENLGSVTLDMHPEDDDGWSRWQLWEVMGDLGPGCFNGAHVLFETTIRMEVKQ